MAPGCNVLNFNHTQTDFNRSPQVANFSRRRTPSLGRIFADGEHMHNPVQTDSNDWCVPNRNDSVSYKASIK